MRLGFITVGLLAVLGFSGCGVGVDDPQGQQAAYGTKGQALLGLDGKPVDPLAGGTAAGGPPVNPNISSLPSDPIPVHGPLDVVIDPMTGLPIPPGATTAPQAR